ncbi:hypothetical protein J41TS12_41350 [Paenibacillus antibioticophila]|uniref:Uncharacterized protein n=1 Tax=Paenibacillus antibioticophila TaxID=1274374 RepID=A0A919XUJ9_9BACL|nr:hypothetical protein J41TS12_41350 [Paenibacillus antibioticophila]
MKIPALSDRGPVWLDTDLLLAVTTSEDKVYLLVREGLYEAPTSYKQWLTIVQSQQRELISVSRSAYVRPDLAIKFDKKMNTIVFDTKRGQQAIKVSRSNQRKIRGLF